MFRIPIIRLLAAALCVLCFAVPAAAAEVDCDDVYCFSPGDFPGEEPITGICITGLPDPDTGTLLLGSRVVRSGDILTAQQVEQLTFSPLYTTADQTAQMEYLPIYETRVAPCTAMTISIRGKENLAPTAEDSTAETYKNLAATAKLKAADPEGLPLTYTLVRQPRRGSVTIGEDGSFTYTPKKNKVGVDSFTYTAADPAGNVSREATVTVTILKPSDAPGYADTAGRECSFAAEWMKHSGIFAGESLGDQTCFQPDREVSRGEFVTMLVKALDIPTDEYLTYTGYTDEVPKWLQPYLAAAVRAGVTAGLPDAESFGASAVITGAEAAVMLQNVLDLSTDVLSQEASDAPDWAQTALHALNANGISLSRDNLTREQAALVLYQSAKAAQELKQDSLV